MGKIIWTGVAALILCAGCAIPRPSSLAEIWERPGRPRVRLEVTIQAPRHCLLLAIMRDPVRPVQIEGLVLSATQMNALADIAAVYRTASKLDLPESLVADKLHEETRKAAEDIGDADIAELVVSLLAEHLGSSFEVLPCPARADI